MEVETGTETGPSQGLEGEMELEFEHEERNRWFGLYEQDNGEDDGCGDIRGVHMMWRHRGSRWPRKNLQNEDLNLG